MHFDCDSTCPFICRPRRRQACRIDIIFKKFKGVGMLMNSRDQFGLIARLLHWLIAVLVIGMLLGGTTLLLLPSGGIKNFVIFVHKSVGATILFLMIVRLIWRVSNPQPHDLTDSPVFNYLARLVHVVLYVLLFLQPLVGTAMSQAFGYPVSVFGLFTLPHVMWRSERLASFLLEVHGVTAIVLTAVIFLHVAAAFKHHLVDRDRTLMRMIEGR
jgi:cytochrome b561